MPSFPPLEMWDVANPMRESIESPKPVVQIERITPLWIKFTKQYTHRATKDNGRLTDEAVGSKAFNSC